jgi:DNA repair protein RadA/Sms
VLEKRAGFSFAQQDVYLNIAGGFRLNDPAGDLGVCCALVSSFIDRPVDKATVFIGEVGLGGELRPVPQMERRKGEAMKLGYQQVIAPEPGGKGKFRFVVDAIKKALPAGR